MSGEEKHEFLDDPFGENESDGGSENGSELNEDNAGLGDLDQHGEESFNFGNEEADLGDGDGSESAHPENVGHVGPPQPSQRSDDDTPQEDNGTAAIGPPQPHKSREKQRGKTRRDRSETSGLMKKVVGAIVVLGVVGGGGFGGYRMLTDEGINLPTPAEFSPLSAESKAEQLDQALETVRTMPADQFREMRREVDALQGGGDEAVEAKLRHLKGMLKFYGDPKSDTIPERTPNAAAQSNVPQNSPAGLEQLTATEGSAAALMLPSRLLWLTAAMMSYQPPIDDIADLKKMIEQLRSELGKYPDPLDRARIFHDLADLQRKLAESTSSTVEALTIISSALKDCSESEGQLNIAANANPAHIKTGARHLNATLNAIRELQFSLRLKSQERAISDQLKAVQNDVMNVRNQVNDVSGNLSKAETELTQTKDALEKVTASDGPIDTLQKDLKVTSDLVSDPDNGLGKQIATAASTITDVKDQVNGTVAQRQEIEKLYRSGIRDFFSLHQLDERFKLARPQPARDDADDGQKAAAEQDAARWTTDNERIQMLAGRLDALDELTGPELVAEYEFLRSVPVQVTRRENERLQQQIAALPTPATAKQIAKSKEVAAHVVEIIRTQITDANGALKDVKQLVDIKLPENLIGQPTIQKMITDAIAELPPSAPGKTTPGTTPVTGPLAAGVTNAQLKALQTLLEKRLVALSSDLTKSITETQQLTDKVSTDLAAQQDAATRQHSELTKKLNDEVVAVDQKVAAESKRRTDQVQQVQEKLEQQIQQAVQVPHPLPDDQLKGITANTVAATIKQLAAWGYSQPTLPPEPTDSTTVENRLQAKTQFEQGYHTFFSRRPDADQAAVRQFSEAVKSDGNDPLFRYYLGLALRCTGQHEAALEQVQIGARLEKRHGGTDRIVTRLDRIQFTVRKWLDRIRFDVTHR